MKTISRHIAVLLITASLLIPATAGAKTLNYRLKWLFNTSVVGDLYAWDQGFFTAAGLDVKVKAGGPERDAIRELELGHAAFGVASADQVIRARAKGAQVAVIAQLFQINPLQWIYRTARPVKSLSDLKGKTLGITFGGNDETILKTLLAKANLTTKDVTLFSVRYDYTPFYQKKVDIWPCYINSQGIMLARKLGKAGEEVGFFNPGDYGVAFVANSVVTSEKLLKKNPRLVQTFAAALIRGWEASLDPGNRDKALAVLQKYNRDTPEEMRKEQLTVTRGIVVPASGAPLGSIDVDAWQQTETIMLNQGLIKKAVHIEKALFPGGRSLGQGSQKE